jgi:DNA-binding response OmpR family regulator
MNKPKILVVDDEPLNLELMEGVFSMDYDVIKASNGIGASILVEKTLPDLIILDVMMPNMNGYAFCRQIKTDIKTRTIPVLMITSLREEKDKLNAIESGADDFLSKPVDINKLRLRVKSLLETRKKHDNTDSAQSNINIYKVF